MSMIGPMQAAILQAIDRNPADACGVAIASAVSESSDHGVSGAQVYVALRRLEQRGLVEMVAEERGGRGRPKKFYALTEVGQAALGKALGEAVFMGGAR